MTYDQAAIRHPDLPFTGLHSRKPCNYMDYRLERDGRLSWPGWFTHSGHFTNEVVTCQIRTRHRSGKVRRPKVDALTTELRLVSCYAHVFVPLSVVIVTRLAARGVVLAANADLRRQRGLAGAMSLPTSLQPGAVHDRAPVRVRSMRTAQSTVRVRVLGQHPVRYARLRVGQRDARLLEPRSRRHLRSRNSSR